jgi:hypothetical protein
MMNIKFGARAVGARAGAASHYGSGSATLLVMPLEGGGGSGCEAKTAVHIPAVSGSHERR